MKKTILFMMVFMFPIFASANYHFCQGTISHLWVDSAGAVQVVGSWRGGHTQLCNVAKDWKEVSTETCKAWLSLSQIAKVSQASMLVRYSSADIESCSAIPTYGAAPKPNYVMLGEA